MKAVNIFLLITVITAVSVITAKLKTSKKKERLMNLLSMVRFNNELCSGTDGRFGSCIPVTQCTQSGGVANGRCAEGFGVCCNMEASCGADIRINNTHFASPGFPGFVARSVSCQVTVHRLSSNICQIRLDLEIFSLSTTSNGVCNTDALRVSGQESSQDIPTICGINDGQHMYVHLSRENQNPVNLMMTTTGGQNKRWKIRVSQFECNSLSAAPSNCLQYFEGNTGTFRSYNFDSPIPDPAGGQANYMNGMNYAICIRREAGFCAVQFKPGDNIQGAFDLDPGTGIDDLSSSDAFCTHDALIIPAATNAGENGLPVPKDPTASKFCGLRLNAVPHSENADNFGVITMLPGLIQVFFNTDSNPPAPHRYDRGFHLRFQQRPCSSLLVNSRLPQPDPLAVLSYSIITPELKIRSRLSKLTPLFYRKPHY